MGCTNAQPTFPGQILQVKFQIVKSYPDTPLTEGPADHQGAWSLIDLMNHSDKSPFALLKTCFSTELCGCLFGIQDCHISSFFSYHNQNAQEQL